MPRHHLRKVYHYCSTIYALEHKPPTVKAIAQACRISVDETRLAIVALRQKGLMVRCIPVRLKHTPHSGIRVLERDGAA